MKKTFRRIVCLDCKKSFKHIFSFSRATNAKKFCDECGKRRKYECIKDSNAGYVSTGNPIGRPPKWLANKGVCFNMVWDEPNFGGY